MYPVLKSMAINLGLSFLVLVLINLFCFGIVALLSDFSDDWSVRYDNLAFYVNGVTAGLPLDKLSAKVLIGTLFAVLTLKDNLRLRQTAP